MSSPVNHDAGGVVPREVGGGVGPPHGAERPEPRAEPGVEHVGVLAQGAAAFAGLGRLLLHQDRPAPVAVPGRHPVSPPELARDAPVVDVVHPLEVGAGPVLGHEPRAAVLHGGDGGLGEGLDAHEPLGRHERLDHGVAAAALSHRVPVVLDPLEQPLGLEPLDDGLARGQAVPARERPRLGRHPAVLADHRHLGQLVPPAHLEVVGVVGRRHLDGPGPEPGVDEPVRDHRQLAADDGQAQLPAHEAAVAVVVGMHRHRGVAQHRLRPRGGHRHPVARGRAGAGPGAVAGPGVRPALDRVGGAPGVRPALGRVGGALGAGAGADPGVGPVLGHAGVAHVVEPARLLLVHHLEVGQRRPAPGAPVHDVLAAVDQPFAVEGDEDPPDRPRQVVVQREALAAPVDRRPQGAHLARDGAVALPAPRPHPLQERLAAEGVAVGPVLGELLLDDVLGRDAGVVGARQPQHVVAGHPLPAAHDVRQGLVEGVADVQHPGDVGGRQHHAERRAGRRRIGAEGAARLPELVPLRVDGGVVEPLAQLAHVTHRIRRPAGRRRTRGAPRVPGRECSWTLWMGKRGRRDPGRGLSPA